MDPNNVVKIKRGKTSPGINVLQEGELGYNTVSKELYIGVLENSNCIPFKINITNLQEGAEQDKIIIQDSTKEFQIDSEKKVHCSALVLKPGVGYGTVLPSNPVSGQIFFQKNEE